MKRTSTRKQERAAFRDMLLRMESYERDKDMFLKAAKLDRHDRAPLLDGNDIMRILMGIGALAALFMLFVLPLMLMGR